MHPGKRSQAAGFPKGQIDDAELADVKFMIIAQLILDTARLPMYGEPF